LPHWKGRKQTEDGRVTATRGGAMGETSTPTGREWQFGDGFNGENTRQTPQQKGEGAARKEGKKNFNCQND